MYNLNRTEPIVKEQFSGIIWKIRLSELSDLVAIETRDTEHKKAAFSVLDVRKNKVYFKEKTFDDSWDLNLTFIGKENLILNGYAPGSPESKGILSVDVNDGSILWQRFDIALNQVDERGVQVFDPRIQPRKYTWIDHISGEVIPPPIDLPPFTGLKLPLPGYFFTMPSFISHSEIVGDILGLEHEGKRMISFHEKTGNFLQQRLLVYQADKVLIDDILMSGIQKLQPEAFLIHRDHLLYVRNKQEITSYLV